MVGDGESLIKLQSALSRLLGCGETEQVATMGSGGAMLGTSGAGGLAAYSKSMLGSRGLLPYRPGYKFPLHHTHSNASIHIHTCSRTRHKRLCYQWFGVFQSLHVLQNPTAKSPRGPAVAHPRAGAFQVIGREFCHRAPGGGSQMG